MELFIYNYIYNHKAKILSVLLILYGLGGEKMNDCDEKNITNHCMLGEDLLGVNSEIARKLRQFYLEIQEEALPRRLLELLDSLERAEQFALNNVEKV